MSEPRAALIWCPFATQAEARAVAEALLEEKLIACANIIPGVVSVYVWQGAIETDSEVIMVMKTTAPKLTAATTRLAQLHPYEVPAVSGWLVDEMPDLTRQWLDGALGSSDARE